MNNSLLNKLGLDLGTEIEGLTVLPGNMKRTNVPNVFQVTAQSADGKTTKTFFVGRKSLDEGILGEDDKGVITIQPGFETYDLNGRIMVRNKARVNNLADLKAID